MAKATSTPTEPATAPAVATVKVRALIKLSAYGCTIAPGKEFHATPEKAEEMVKAGAVVILPPSF